MKEIDDVSTLLEGIRKKKGRMDANSRAKATELIPSLLRNSEEPLGNVFPILEELQSDVVADALAIAWPGLSSDRRLEIRRWLPIQRTERAQRRNALLAATRCYCSSKLEWATMPLVG